MSQATHINSFPEEILVKIFGIVMEDALVPVSRSGIVKGYITPGVGDCDPPFNLIGTCDHWAEIMLTTPALWPKSIAGIFKEMNFTPQAMENYLQASEGSRLDLALYPDKETEIADLSCEAHEGLSLTMLDLFFTYSGRWNSLCIKLNTVESIDLFVEILEAKASQSPLCKLEILLQHDLTPDSLIQDLLSNIALFRSLNHFAWILDCLQFYRIGIPRDIQWNSLQVVYVDADIPFEDCIWCLQQCISATDVTFLTQYQSRKRKLDFNAGVTTLPRLISLKINKYCRVYEFVKYFSLPSLASLKIEGLEVEGCSESDALEEFFRMSGCPLRHFEVDDTFFNTMNDQEIARCLCMPYLKSVPEVWVTVSQLPRYWEKVTSWQGSRLRNGLGITTWTDDSGLHIGWKKNRN